VTAKRRLLDTTNRALLRAGVRLERISASGAGNEREVAERRDRDEQDAAAQMIVARHNAQTPADVQRLSEKYATPILGEVNTWDLLMMLGACVDPTDGALATASQLVHVLQTLEAMISDVLPRDLALLVRYHSVMPRDLEPYLASSDRAFAERLHGPFFRYDQESKSAVRRPRLSLEDFRDLIRRRLPSRLEI
jgi:hypothetical protein